MGAGICSSGLGRKTEPPGRHRRSRAGYFPRSAWQKNITSAAPGYARKSITTRQKQEVKGFIQFLEDLAWGARYVLGFDRVGIFLYNPARHAMDATLGTDRSGQLEEKWDHWYALSGIQIFTRLLEKPKEGMYFTHNYEVENGSGLVGQWLALQILPG